jgi:threonine/homoserine/homoserine lactone efflux protein
MAAPVEALAGLAVGLATGFSLAAPPGPMNAIIADQSARHGARTGIRVGVAAPIVDTLYLALFVAGLPLLLDVDRLLPYASAAGAALLAYFAVGTARSALAPPETTTKAASFWGVFALSATNPYQLGWWASGGTALMASAGAWGVAGFLAAIFGWVVVFALLVDRGARRWAWLQGTIAVVSADLLVALALLLAARATQAL